jgi:hypothetical protein
MLFNWGSAHADIFFAPCRHGHLPICRTRSDHDQFPAHGDYFTSRPYFTPEMPSVPYARGSFTRAAVGGTACAATRAASNRAPTGRFALFLIVNDGPDRQSHHPGNYQQYYYCSEIHIRVLLFCDPRPPA